MTAAAGSSSGRSAAPGSSADTAADAGSSADTAAAPAGALASPTFSTGFDGTLTSGPRRTVVAVDLMRAYFEEASPLRLSSWCLDGAAAVLAAARAAGNQVFHTVVRFDAAARGGVFLRKVPARQLLISESPGSVPPLGELMPEVATLEGEAVLVKQGASAFFGTDLARLLLDAGVDTAIIVGVSTSGCVRATAVDAVQHNFVPIVVREAVGNRDEAVQAATL